MINYSNFKPKLLIRKRIDDKLSSIIEKPLFYISSAMGYGKTTLVSSYMENLQNSMNVVWFSVLIKEYDAVWLWNRFADKVSALNDELGKKIAFYGVPKCIEDINNIITLLHRQLKEEIIIVIDDYQNLKDKDSVITELIRTICMDDLLNLHIVIISRESPEAQYIELENMQKAVILRQSEMEFTKSETKDFFKLNGFELTETQLSKLYKYTEGWVSATYLALYEFYENSSFDNVPKAEELIKKVIYNKLDEETKKILIQLCVLENFTLSEAEYITKSRKANDVIINLTESNFFIKYNYKSKKYTIHTILRNVLLNELKYSGIDADKIYNSCGDWYLKKKNEIIAMQYYYKSRNYKQIFNLFENRSVRNYTEIAPNLIRTVFENIEMEEKLKHPIAYLSFLNYYILRISVKKGAELLAEAKRYYEKCDLENKNYILGEIMLIESFCNYLNPDEMYKRYKKVYELFDGKTSRIVWYEASLLGTPDPIIISYIETGKLKERIIKIKDESVKYYIAVTGGECAGAEYLTEAEYYCLTGDFIKAEISAKKSLYRSEERKSKSIAIGALFALARVYIQINEKQKLLKCIEELEEINNSNLLISEKDELLLFIKNNVSNIETGYNEIKWDIVGRLGI